MNKLKELFSLFVSFFKIGLITFGGGYAMIAIIERELIERKKWIGHEEFLDVIAIAESTPGPIAINSATYIGYKKSGILGAVFATFGVVLPSFIIICLISLFFDVFLSLEYVKYAFSGIQAGVVFLILSAGIKMFKSLKKDFISILLFVLTVGCLIAFSLLSVSFSSIIYILVGGVVGLTLYLCSFFKDKKTANKPIDKEEK